MPDPVNVAIICLLYTYTFKTNPLCHLQQQETAFLFFFFFFFFVCFVLEQCSNQIRFDNLCELSTMQKDCRKCQALFSWKDKEYCWLQL